MSNSAVGCIATHAAFSREPQTTWKKKASEFDLDFGLWS